MPGGAPSFANYAAVLFDPFYSGVFANTVGIAARISLLALLIGYPYALAVVRWAGGAQNLLLWALYTPLLVSVMVRALGCVWDCPDDRTVNVTGYCCATCGRSLLDVGT